MYTVGKGVAKLFMWTTGWHVAGTVPDHPKAVIIAAPHTSNWDFVYLMAAAMVLKLPIYWLGKKELFAPPLGFLMSALRGIPVDRSASTNLVQQVVERMNSTKEMSVVVPPSGTRGKAKHWRSGFYWVAQQAEAQIVCGYLDYAKKEAGLGHRFFPSGDVGADMQLVREFYKPITGKFPDQLTPVRLKEEE